ncbi:O-acetyl-ADP-ribose deacetylase [Microbacter margulisiae]|uniref:O-acetyl-ADP-ribose deacetylase (Regulator of RNase III) n=1 Tax=Microbacter margulisiae TaxID=1350067 RepID=A0A7W5GZX3_9PORP|nr:O-acetyl-ADP-ribose deacetylase [Microbacter margulisiae]MBB3185928.1 O-acetyl-ADP-ribose deacetylase (regulator of RNase III) [Microbacter margulisiae]
MIQVLYGDITKVAVDAVVNAANNSLLGGGGVDGAIHRAGGQAIIDECILIRQKQGGCETGHAVVTTAGNLSARYVIHTVGPVWRGGWEDEAQLLKNAYTSCLDIALEKGVRSIAFPNISTGVYHFPKDEAAHIAIHTVIDYLNAKNVSLDVWFVCFDNENYSIYKRLLTEVGQ